MLILSYTNHALDQFLEDLMDMGISQNDMVRLGSKSTSRTDSLKLSNQIADGRQRNRGRQQLIDTYMNDSQFLEDKIDQCFGEYKQDKISPTQLLELLEFSDTEEEFYDALSVPAAQEGDTRVGRKGAKMRPDFLFERWKRGKTPGPFTKEKSGAPCKKVWTMPKNDRQLKIRQWEKDIREERVAVLCEVVTKYNEKQKVLNDVRKEKEEGILQRKRIIGCTTTAASMYAQEIQAAKPGIIIAEEAGEILESRMYTPLFLFTSPSINNNH